MTEQSEQPAEDQQSEAAADRAQEAAAPTQADVEAQDTTTAEDDGQGEPQPA